MKIWLWDSDNALAGRAWRVSEGRWPMTEAVANSKPATMQPCPQQIKHEHWNRMQVPAMSRRTLRCDKNTHTIELKRVERIQVLPQVCTDWFLSYLATPLNYRSYVTWNEMERKRAWSGPSGHSPGVTEKKKHHRLFDTLVTNYAVYADVRDVSAPVTYRYQIYFTGTLFGLPGQELCALSIIWWVTSIHFACSLWTVSVLFFLSFRPKWFLLVRSPTRRRVSGPRFVFGISWIWNKY